jgi:hypothetical protein
MKRFKAVLDKAAKASAFFFAISAFDLVTTADSFSQIFEFVFVVKKDFRSPKSTKFMNKSVLMINFNRSIDRSTFDPHVLILTGASAECTDLKLRHYGVDFIMWAFLKNLKLVSHDLSTAVELDLILSFSSL